MSNTKDLSKIPDNITYVSDYTELRAYTGKARSIYVTGYLATAVPSGIAGLFVKDNTDITSLDNGGTILINSSNIRFKRVYNGDIDIRWFNVDLTGTTVCKAQILAAHKAGATVNYTDGTYNLGDLQQVGSVQDVAVDFTGLGSIHMKTTAGVIFKTNMTSLGITYAFKFDGNSHSTVGDCRFIGYGYDSSATWKGTSAFLINGGNWGNISFGKIYCKNIVQPIVVGGGDLSNRIRGITIDSIFADDCYYGYNASNQGDDVIINNIYAYQCYRAFFVYGCTGVTVNKVFIRKPRSTTGAICIASYPGFITKDINVTFTTDDVDVGATVNHVLFENFGPAYSTSGINGCNVVGVINDINSGNPLVKIVTYDASGGSEVSAPTASQFHDNSLDIKALGSSGRIVCTAQYSSPQRNNLIGNTSELLDYTAMSRIQWSSILPFTPAWTADGGTFPTIGNGTLSGECYVENKRMYVNVNLTIGSTTTLGSGAWYFGTPYGLPTKATLISTVGSGRILRSGVSFKLASVTQAGNSSNVQLTSHDGVAQIGPITPHAWAVNDNIQFSYSFPI